MIAVSSGVRVFIATTAVDMRKAHDGLCAIVRDGFQDDPFSGDLFVFFNRRRDRVKLLEWDDNGFWLHYKRLEGGCFEGVPASSTSCARLQLDRAQLTMLLEGIELKSSKRRKHFVRGVRPKSRTR